MLVFISTALFAQQGSVKGFIYDNQSGESIQNSTIFVLGTEIGTYSDLNGAFYLNKIPEGQQVIKVTAFGYIDILDTLTIGKNTITRRYSLKRTSRQIGVVNVTAESQRKIQETRTSVVSITPQDMNKMPSIGGQPDFAQYLQVLPGVVSTGDQGGQLYIRGGTPIQNLLLLDGMTLYAPFHSIGLFSVFDADIMQSADVYTGGFGAEFGGRISSVMDIKTRNGNRKRTSGKIDGNMFGAKVLLEGPFVKLKDNRKTSLSYILSAKGSFLEQSSKVFYPYVKEGLPFNFLDFYGKVSLSSLSGTKFNIFGFSFNDKVNYPEIAEYGWQNWGVGTNFLIVPEGIPTTIEGSFSYTDYTSHINDIGYDQKESSLKGANFNLKFNYYQGMNYLGVGIEAVVYQALYKFDEYIDPLEDFTTDLSLFAKYKVNIKNKVLIEPSFRLQYYASMNAISPEPRLAIKYNVTKKVRLKLAAGLYSQNFTAITSDRDVVSLFQGYLSSPSGLIDNFEGKEMKSALQKSQHVVLGLELDVVKNLSLNIEGYFKNFSQLTVANRYKLFEYDNDFIWEKGWATGGDLTVKFDYKNFYIWGVYSLGWVKRNDGEVVYSPHFDRRHNVNLVASYAFGQHVRKTWQIDLRWNFGTGFPFTQTQGVFPHISGTNLGENVNQNNNDMYFLLGELNQGKLPSYHRLDFNLKKKFFIGEHNLIELNLSITNVYNYKNIFYVNRVSQDIIYQLPLLYSLGVTWSF